MSAAAWLTSLQLADTKIATTSRGNKTGLSKDGYFHVQRDLTNPGIIESVFKSVKLKLGIPNVVVYNGMTPFAEDRLLGMING